jgi:hypothetical protein
MVIKLVCKGLESKYFRVWKPCGLYHVYSANILWKHPQTAVKLNKHGFVPIKQFRDSEIWIPYVIKFHYYFYFFQTFKSVESIPNLQFIQKQVAGHSNPTKQLVRSCCASTHKWRPKCLWWLCYLISLPFQPQLLLSFPICSRQSPFSS